GAGQERKCDLVQYDLVTVRLAHGTHLIDEFRHVIQTRGSPAAPMQSHGACAPVPLLGSARTAGGDRGAREPWPPGPPGRQRPPPSGPPPCAAPGSPASDSSSCLANSATALSSTTPPAAAPAAVSAPGTSPATMPAASSGSRPPGAASLPLSSASAMSTEA